MSIARFDDYCNNVAEGGSEPQGSGFLQSRFPLISCNHSLKDITRENYGYCYGVTSDQIPFEAEMWFEHNPESTNISIYLPEIEEFNEIEEEPLINDQTGTRTFNYKVDRRYNTALCDGMVDRGSIESLSLLNTYIELLIDYGMVKFTTNVYNAAAWRLIDFSGNDIVAINITLEENGEIMATTPLVFTPFIERRNTQPKFRIMEYVPEVYGYLAGDMDVGSFDGVLLYRLLQKKKLGYEELHDLCCAMGRLIDSAAWVDTISPIEMERAIELILEQAVTLMPLKIDDYEMLNQFDEWQEENGSEDNEKIDNAVNTIFLDNECRNVIEAEARKGRHLDLAADIGICV